MLLSYGKYKQLSVVGKSSSAWVHSAKKIDLLVLIYINIEVKGRNPPKT